MHLTLAIDRYDRLMPFHDGTVEMPSGLDLEVMQVGQEGRLRDGAHRHERMLQKSEFDAAEVSLSSYIASCARGQPFTAIPVFPRRLFSIGQVFVRDSSSFSHPRELSSRTIGLQSFQTTLAVLAKGDLAAEYDLDLRSVRWRTRSADTVETAEAPSFQMKRLDPALGLVEALVQGEVDAIFYSRTPWRDPDPTLPIRRLFANPEAEERRYLVKNGYWPIMHLIVLKKEVIERKPELPAQLMGAFASAQRIADSYVDDPGWSRLAWTKYAREREVAALGASLWPLGVAANRANLERFIGYSYEQGIIDRRIAIEDLFHPSVHAT
jgi:4,5-dihydroxyphthalate decarboxylase